MQPQIAIPRQMIWINAVQNMLHAGKDAMTAIGMADAVLDAYEYRFVPPPAPVVQLQGGLNKEVATNA